jgi:hypothetical protein
MIRRLLILPLLAALLLLGLPAFAALSPSQLTTLKAAIVGNPTWNALPNNDDGNETLASILNGTAAPDFIVNKTTLSRHDILTGTSLAATTFTWTGGAYITRSQGEREAFREIFNSTGTVDPRLPSIVAAFADIFSGPGGLTNRTHIAEMSKRKATFAEKILATGTGTLVAPANMSFEGKLTSTDVASARNMP